MIMAMKPYRQFRRVQQRCRVANSSPFRVWDSSHATGASAPTISSSNKGMREAGCDLHATQEDTTMLKVTIFALALLLSGAAIACPFGYVPCGETGQLCCPAQ
jgi:hypothetical protein